MVFFIVWEFILGGLIFGIVPIILSLLGFIAANPEFSILVTDPQMVAPAVIEHFLPAWSLLLFTLMSFAGLCSTIDSAYCSISSFMIADISDQKSAEKQKILIARKGIILFAVIGTGIALFQPPLLWIFFTYGALVSVVFFPTLFSIFADGYSSNAAFWSIVLGFLFSVPLSLYANMSENENLVVLVAIFSMFIGLLVSLAFLFSTKSK